MATLQDFPQNTPTETQVQLSVVVPVYNQEKNVSLSLARIKDVLDSLSIRYEIVIVNDGSLDNTARILYDEAKADPRVRIITYSPNKGKGYAVKTGITASSGQSVMFTDGDLDISPAIISEYIKALRNCDLVIASKRHPLSKVRAPYSRKFLSRAFNLFVRISTGIELKDTQSGLKAGNGETLRTIFKVLLVKRYAFDVELLTIASALNLTIRELPVEITLTKQFRIREILMMLTDVLAICYRYRIVHWYQKQLSQAGN